MPTRASRARSSGVAMPLSPTMMRSRGTMGASRSLVASVVSKVLRSRLLMPIRRDFSLSARSSSSALWTSSSTSMPSAKAASSSALRGRVVDAGHDDQDAVGAPGARLRDLIGLVHEVLAQRRQRGGVARGGQELGPALERRRVGEHRQAGRAAGLVGARQRRRIEIGADQSLRRARLLDLGDQRIVAGRKLALDRREEAARRRRGLGRGLDRRRASAHAWRPRSLRACRPRSWQGCRPWLASGVRHFDEPVEPRLGGAGVDRFRRLLDALLEILGVAGDDQARRGVHDRDVAERRPWCP